MTAWSPNDLRRVFQRLHANGWTAILAGGQAVNLLVETMEARLQKKGGTLGLDSLKPFTSQDLDFLGGPADVVILRKTFSGKCKINKGFEPTPNAGAMVTRIDGRNLHIDVLTFLGGIDSAEAEATAISVDLSAEEEPVSIRVLHPLLCILSKAHNLRHLAQAGRQDEKQLRAAIAVLRQHLKEWLADPRHVLNVVNRIHRVAMTEEGLHAYSIGIDLLEAIPLAEMKCIANEKLTKFAQEQAPRMENRIQEKRKTREKSLRILQESENLPIDLESPGAGGVGDSSQVG